MKVYSEFSRWVTYRAEINYSKTYYVYCEKRLFRRPRILGTNIKIEKKQNVNDITLKRYGNPVVFHRLSSWLQCYEYDSGIACFEDKTSRSVISTDIRYSKVLKTYKLYKRNKFDIKYLLHHIQIAEVRIPEFADIIPGYTTMGHNMRCILSKQIKVIDIYNIDS